MKNAERKGNLSVDQIKKAANGREIEVLEHVAGIPAEYLDGKGHPCPKCGEGVDRFSLIDADRGAVLCRHCFHEKNGDFVAAVQHFRGVDLPEALRLIGEYLGTNPGTLPPVLGTKKKAVGTWVYTDQNKKPLYRVTRLEWIENGKREKSFSQERFAGGKWQKGLDGIKPVPLNWPAIGERSDEPVFIVEGEKCCDALSALGVLATTSSGGKDTKIDWSRFLPGVAVKRRVAILPDNDRGGYEYALKVANQLHGSNEIKVLFLPGFAPKGDVADWIAAGGTSDEFSRIIEETPPWDGKPFRYEGDEPERTASPPAGKEEKLVRPPLEWEPFPIEAFPEPIQRYVTESAGACGVDPGYVAPFVLSAVSSMVGSAYRIRLKDGWDEPSSIWTALVAESGSGKSPALDAAVGPIREFQQRRDEEYRESLEEFERDKMQFEIDLAKWKKKDSAFDSQPERPTPPIPSTLLVDDTTVEAVAEITEDNPCGVLLPKDELSGWLGCFDAYKSGSSSKDLSFWLSV